MANEDEMGDPIERGVSSQLKCVIAAIVVIAFRATYVADPGQRNHEALEPWFYLACFVVAGHPSPRFSWPHACPRTQSVRRRRIA